MIIDKENISKSINIFHDGTICGFKELSNGIRIKIDCYYLSSRINAEFESFYIDILNPSIFEFMPWSDNGFSRKRISDLAIFGRWEFNIFSCKIENEICQIDLEIENPKTAMIGGVLNFDCKAIRIYDQSKSEMRFKELVKLSEDYWAEFKK